MLQPKIEKSQPRTEHDMRTTHGILQLMTFVLILKKISGAPHSTQRMLSWVEMTTL
jgi:hypothetical protein